MWLFTIAHGYRRLLVNCHSVACHSVTSIIEEPACLVSLICVFQVENWCPHLPWRAKNPYEEADHNSLVSDLERLFLCSWVSSSGTELADFWHRSWQFK